MIIPKDINLKYNYLSPHFTKVKELLDQTLINYCSLNHFAYLSRIKNLDSLAEKIESGRFKDWNSVDDFIAAVIIVPNISYEANILKFLQNTFEMVELKKRCSTSKKAEEFRFDSTRFIGKIISYDTINIINTINFEVQIRSAFEHAWSVTTHDLSYKSNIIDWKILRLSAQLKSSIEQLDMIILGADMIIENIQEHKWPETELKILICNKFTDLFENNLIPNELKPKDMSRFTDNLYNLIRKSINVNYNTNWLHDTKNILNLIETYILNEFKNDFPFSLSLYQLCFGILLKENIISKEVSKKIPFHKGELFYTIFPECKMKIINEFIIN